MTETFWELLPYHDVFISTLVQEEINSASGSLREKLKEKIRDFTVLEITTDADELAQDYIEQSIFSERYSNDALHVAIAVIHRIEYLISWNFTHLVKVKILQTARRTGSSIGKSIKFIKKISSNRDNRSSGVITHCFIITKRGVPVTFYAEFPSIRFFSFTQSLHLSVSSSLSTNHHERETH